MHTYSPQYEALIRSTILGLHAPFLTNTSRAVDLHIVAVFTDTFKASDCVLTRHVIGRQTVVKSVI